MSIVKTIEKFIPERLLLFYRSSKWNIKHHIYENRYNRTLMRLRNCHNPVNIVFFVLEATNWKYDYLYHLLENDPSFNVSVLVCERMDIEDEGTRIRMMKKCFAMCLDHGYRTYEAYNDETKEIFNPHLLRPDIIFYSNPYKGFYRKGYYMNSFKHSLICYSNYSYEIIPFTWAFTGLMQNLSWRYFCESKGHQQLVVQYSPFKGHNTVVSGYPVIDAYMKNDGLNGEWKIADRNIKRIIWAPHQSIYDTNMSNAAAVVHFSTFLLYADFMLELSQKYQDKIQIAFKPHPFLKRNLYGHSEWGKERTDRYYKKWAEQKNTCYVDSDYVNLFCSSDALIHDCGSFTAEYLCTQKPCMYLATYMNGDNMNEMGKGAFNSHYHGFNKEDIEKFIKDVIIGGNDPLREKRKEFFAENLLPPNGKSVAENIICEIKKELHI